MVFGFASEKKKKERKLIYFVSSALHSGLTKRISRAARHSFCDGDIALTRYDERHNLSAISFGVRICRRNLLKYLNKSRQHFSFLFFTLSSHRLNKASVCRVDSYICLLRLFPRSNNLCRNKISLAFYDRSDISTFFPSRTPQKFYTCFR